MYVCKKKVSVMGAEPLVLEGLQSLVGSGKARAIMFQYTSRWLHFSPDFSYNLRSTMRDLWRWGLSLFLVTNDSLVPISGSCWSDAYEMPSDGNTVLALHRKSIDIQAVRQAYENLPTLPYHKEFPRTVPLFTAAPHHG